MDDPIEIRILNTRIGTHLGNLSEMVAILEVAVGDVFRDPTASRQSTISDLQSLDFLRQSLQDISKLSIALAEQTTGSVASDLLCSIVNLDSTKAIILDNDCSPRSSQGDIDLL